MMDDCEQILNKVWCCGRGDQKLTIDSDKDVFDAEGLWWVDTVEMVSNLYDIDANKTTFTVTFAILMHRKRWA